MTAHTFCECIATHLIEAGCDIQTVRELFGRNDVRSEMVYIHVLNRGVSGGVGSADFDLPDIDPVSDDALAISRDEQGKQ